MNVIAIEILTIFILLLLNGVFAMTELATVSSRRTRLKAMADEGSKGAKTALVLLDDPTRFLSSVQIGITLIGILAGAFGGATISKVLAAQIANVPVIANYADSLALGAVVVSITFFSLIIGELVPKRLAMLNPERIASAAAVPMTVLARVAGPVVHALSVCTEFVLRALRVPVYSPSSVTEEEVTGMVREGMVDGIFHPEEGEMIEGVLALDRVRVREIMTPRPRIVWLSVDETHDEIWRKIVVGNHSQFPVFEGTRDNVVGFVSVKSIYANLAAGIPIDLHALSTAPEIASQETNALQLLRQFKKERHHIALVTDEFGGVSGIVTLVDLLESIVGDLPDSHTSTSRLFIERADGSLLVDALVGVEELEERLPNVGFDDGGTRRYFTLAGFVSAQLGHLPSEGEVFVKDGWTFEIVDMDRHRVDKVLITPPSEPPATETTTDAT